MKKTAMSAMIALALGTSLASAKDLVITNARLIDGTGAAPVEGVNIHISNDRIISVGNGNVNAPGAEVIDAKGKTVLPGLSELHVHSSLQFLIQQRVSSACTSIK